MIYKPIPTLTALNELFTRHLLTAKECSEVARMEWWKWEEHLNQALLTKPAEVVQEACQVLETHGYMAVKKLSELYYSSTLCQVVFQTVGGTKSCNAHMYTLTPHSHSTRTNLVCLARPSLMW